MLNLSLTTDKIQAITSAAATLDVHCSYVDLTTTTGGITPDKQNTAISTATTTDIVAVPGANVVRNVKTINIRNKDASLSCDVTVRFLANATAYELIKVTLKPADVLEYIEGVGWYVVTAAVANLTNEATSSQTGFAADTYLVGSNISVPSNLPVVGTAYKLVFDVTKTNVGTATPIITIRYGTAGSVADTSRCSFTFGAGSAAVDTAIITILVVFRTVGSGASAVMQGSAFAQNILASTGWTTVVKAVVTTGGGFDSTVANSIIGASYNGGASAAHTIQLVRSELVA